MIGDEFVSMETPGSHPVFLCCIPSDYGDEVTYIIDGKNMWHISDKSDNTYDAYSTPVPVDISKLKKGGRLISEAILGNTIRAIDRYMKRQIDELTQTD